MDTVRLFANWAWDNHPSPDVAPEICLPIFGGTTTSLASVPGLLIVMSVPCFLQLLSKAAGMLMILGACLNKAPIVFNLMKSKSAEGMSRVAIYLDLIVNANCAMYGMLEGHPFTAYGENFALYLQTIMIVVLIWNYGGNSKDSSSSLSTSILEKLFVVLVGSAQWILALWKLPSDWNYMLMSSLFPIILYARGLQIMETYRIKHTGANSIVTIGMSLLGVAIRILTTIGEIGFDFPALSIYSLSLSLNVSLCVQYFVYKENTQRFLQAQQQKKEKKE